MSETYTPNADNFPDGYTAPEDGDAKPVASIRAMLEGVADAVAFMEARTLGVAKPGSATQIPVPFTPVNVYGLAAGSDRFIFSSVANLGLGWLQTNVTDAGAVVFDLSSVLPKKCRITYITAIVACAAHAADPVSGGATLPKLTLLSEDTTQKITPTVVGAQSDLSVSQAAYEARHVITLDLGGMNYNVQDDYRYYVQFEGETGTNAEANKLMLKGIVLTVEEP